MWTSDDWQFLGTHFWTVEVVPAAAVYRVTLSFLMIAFPYMQPMCGSFATQLPNS